MKDGARLRTCRDFVVSGFSFADYQTKKGLSRCYEVNELLLTKNEPTKCLQFKDRPCPRPQRDLLSTFSGDTSTHQHFKYASERIKKQQLHGTLLWGVMVDNIRGYPVNNTTKRESIQMSIEYILINTETNFIASPIVRTIGPLS